MEEDNNRDAYNIGNRTNRRLRINGSSSSDQLINNSKNLNGMSYGTRGLANGTSDEEEAMNYMSPAVTPASSSSKFSWISSSAPNSSTHGGLEEEEGGGGGGEDENGAHNYYDVEGVEESFDDEHQYIYDGEHMQTREPLQSKNYSGHFGSNNNISSVRDDLGRVAYGSRGSLKKAESSWGSFSFKKSIRSLKNFAVKQKKHFDLLKFDPTVVNLKEDVNFQTYTCPRCKTVQREFFSINTYVGHDSYSTNPLIIGTLYLSAYMLVSIYVFGNEEGWDPLDCIYFSVITLTTAGLGDFTPTTDSSKLFAIVFIYIGVAMIGLLLGGLLASSMDDISREKAKIANEQNCPNCKRIRAHMQGKEIGVHYGNHYGTSRTDSTFTPDLGVQRYKWNSERGTHLDTRRFGSMESVQEEPEKSPPHDARHKRRISEFDVDDVPLPIRGHVRHMSEVGGDFNWTSVHKVKPTIHTVPNDIDGDDSSYGSSSFSSYFSYDPLLSQESKGMEILGTIRNATMNSLVVIFVGAFGFYLIEESFTVIDSFYFTIVLLTTVGYGDIVPKTNNGKLFATAYVLLGGTLLLGEMSRISMIPLDLRRQRIEAAILKQFGSHLDEAGFRELTSGDLIREIRESLKSEAERKLDKKRAREQQSKDIEGTKLDPLSCTREEFLVAMFVRLGKVSMDDVQAIMGVFDRLDAGNDGVLNSRDIIFGEIQRRTNTSTMENWERFQRRSKMPVSFNRNCKDRHHSSYDRSMGYTNDVYCSSESESQDDQLSYCSYDSAPETSLITDKPDTTKSKNMKRSVSTPSFLFFDHLTGDTEGV